MKAADQFVEKEGSDIVYLYVRSSLHLPYSAPLIFFVHLSPMKTITITEIKIGTQERILL